MASARVLVLLLLLLPLPMTAGSYKYYNGWIPVKPETLGSAYWEKLPAHSKSSIRKFRERSFRTVGGVPVSVPFSLWVVTTRHSGLAPPLLADCTGVLVAPSWFLTSALCLQGEAPHALVYAGVTNSSEAALVHAQKRFLHSALRAPHEDLLLLANTTKSFRLCSHVWPAELPTHTHLRYIWRYPVRCLVSGVGKTGLESCPLQLRASPVQVRSLCTHWAPITRLCSLDSEDPRPSGSAADSGGALLCPTAAPESHEGGDVLRLRGLVLGYRMAALEEEEEDQDDVTVTEYVDLARLSSWISNVIREQELRQMETQDDEQEEWSPVAVAVGIVLLATAALYCSAFVISLM